MKKIALFTLLILGSKFLSAQNGWELLLNNQHNKARDAFEKTLSKDSMNLAALKGMIFLCDIEGDEKNYGIYANRLVKLDWNSYYFSLFPVKDKTEALSKNTSLSAASKVGYDISYAGYLFEERKFDQAKSIFHSSINFLNWSYLGPFPNNNGYGYSINYAVEQEKFNPEKTYTSDVYNDLKWVSPTYPHSRGLVKFTSHLREENKGGVYYAHSYFKTTSDIAHCEFRINRKYPFKLWIDGQLAYQDPDIISNTWDNEIIITNLPAGEHELLIKYVIGSYFTGIDGGNSYNELEDLFSYDYSSNSGSTSFYNGYRVGNDMMALRICDSSGKLIPVEALLATPRTLNSDALHFSTIRHTTLSYFKTAQEKNQNDPFLLYCLFKAGEQLNLLQELEPIILNYYRKNKSVVFYKYIMSQCYTANGKAEKADRIMSSIDMKEAPIMANYQKQLKEIDQNNEPENYLSLLQVMHQLSPSNYSIIKKIITFYDKQGKEEERKQFAKDKIKEFPEYKTRLEEYLENKNKPTDYSIGNKNKYSSTDQEKRAAKNIKKSYFESDYDLLIKKYKGEKNNNKVLALYDEQITIFPSKTKYRIGKAEYLFNVDRLDEALTELHYLISNYPYRSSYFELIGDIHSEKKDNDSALYYYNIAKSLSTESGGYFRYNSNSLESKITKITGLKQLKNKFITKTYEEIVADTSWKSLYANEESVVTFLGGDFYYDESGKVNYYSKMVIEILTEAGANSWTQYDFGFLGDLTIAKVIKKNGNEVNPDRSRGMIVFKNLQPGDRIRLEGSSEWTPQTEIGKFFYQFNILSAHAPIYNSKIEVALPSNNRISTLTAHIKNNYDSTSRDGFSYYKWDYQNIPKAVEEDAVLDKLSIYSILQFGTLNNWSKVVEWYLGKTYRKLEPNYELTAICDSIIRPGMSDQEKVITIYNYITKDINYSFTPLLQSNYIPRNSDLTISSRIGDCKDVATVMISMLRYVGIESYYVLVKTNKYFHLETLPSTLFDHVIAAYVIDGKMNYLDLTTNQYPYYVLNENDIGAFGLLIKEGVNQLTVLPNDHLDSSKNLVTHKINAVLTKDKSLSLDVESTFSGLEGGYLRETYFDVSKENFEQELLHKMGKGAFENINIEKSDLKNIDDFTAPLQGNFKMKSINYSDHIMNIHFMRLPFMVNVRAHPVISNTVRFNTIDLNQITETAPCQQELTITIADGNTLMNVPKDIELKSKYGIYTLRFKKIANNKIQVTKYQQFYTDKIPAAEFEAFKEFYLKLLEMDRTKIAINVK